MSYPDLKNGDPTLLKITFNFNEINELKHKTKKHDFESFLK